MATYGVTSARSAREVNLKPGKVIAFEMPAAGIIYKGDIVKILASGYVNSVSAPAQYGMVAGIALETVDNRLGLAGDKTIRVNTEGVCPLYLVGGVNVTDRGTFAVHSTAAANTGNEKSVTSGATNATNALTVGAIVGITTDDMTRAASITKEDVYLLALQQVKQT